MKFFVGLHQPSDAHRFARAFISVNRVRSRSKPLGCGAWIMDSGAFTEIAAHGQYRASVEEYAAVVRRWALADQTLLAAVAQDWMCEPWIVAKTGRSVEEHQRLTIERYDQLKSCDVGGALILPVLQGYAAEDYARHVEAYGDRLDPGCWVGVGSVCKRNGDAWAVADVLAAIKRRRPDLRLHGFGLKITALTSGAVRDLLHTADSMAWSWNARRNGRNANDWREARRFAESIDRMPVQLAFDCGVAA